MSCLQSIELYSTIILNILLICGIVKGGRDYWKYKKKKEIENDIEVRTSIQTGLAEYINQSKIKDIGLRLVYYKNYPNLYKNNDGFKYLLYIDYRDSKPINTYLDHDGIMFENSNYDKKLRIYLDKEYGIYYFGKEEKMPSNFECFPLSSIKIKLPYENILKVDFDTTIEYEPVVYVKFKNNNKRLFTNNIIICAGGINMLYLKNSSRLYKYSKIKYRLLKTWLKLT